MGSDDEHVKVGGLGTDEDRRKLRAQAASLKRSGIKLRHKDPGRSRRRKERKKTRQAIVLKVVVTVVACVLGIAVATYFLARQISKPSKRILTEKELTLEGTFVCEKCAHKWSGKVIRGHAFSPYVTCMKCQEAKARKATQCPSCKRWILEDIPGPDKPFEQLNKGEYKRWEWEVRSSRPNLKCPRCGALLYPPR